MDYCTYITYHPIIMKFYIGKGKTSDVLSGKYKGSGTRLNNYFKKYNKDEWITSIIEIFKTAIEALRHEAYLVDKEMLKDEKCLNLIVGGGSTPICSQETRDLISENGKGRIFSEETRKKISDAATGRKRNPELGPVIFTEEHRKKISAARAGQKLPPQSQEHKDKIAKSLTGKTRTEEQRANISNSLMGKKVSDEARANMSKARKGKPPYNKFSEEEIMMVYNLRVSGKDFDEISKITGFDKGKCYRLYGKTKHLPQPKIGISEEHKQKLSESLKGRRSWNRTSEEIEQQIYNLKISGKTFREISEVVGLDTRACWRCFNRKLTEVNFITTSY